MRGTLRNHGERQRVAERDAIRRLAEIHQACRADALDVAAERHEVEIGLEQLALGIARLEPERGGDLAQLACRRSRVQAPRQPGQLHGQRRTALTVAAAIRLERGPRERKRVDAGVHVEGAIFFQQKRVHEVRRHLRQRDPETILIVGRTRYAKQLAVC